MQETIKTLDYIQSKIDLLKTSNTKFSEAIPYLNDKIKAIDETVSTIAESREYLRKAIDVIYNRSVGELNERLNAAIKYIFYDRDLSVELKLEDKRTKSMHIVLKDENGDEISVKDGIGQGVRTVISSILHIYYLNSRNSKILLIDEKYSFLSQAYVERFFDFLKKLCQATDFSIIMITHDTRFLEFCDNKIRIVNGAMINE